MITKPTNKAIAGITIAVILTIGGVAAVRTAQLRDAAAPPSSRYAIVVSTITPEIQQVTLTLPYMAIVQNDDDVVLASKTAARVESVLPSGTAIKKGATIVRLDHASIASSIQSVNSQLSAQRTALTNLAASHKRTQALIAVKGASIEQSEMEESRIAESESKIESLNQNLNDLRNALTYATITSPTSGMISKTLVNVGDMSMPGQPIAIISANRGAYLKLSVPADLKVYGVSMNNTSYDAVPLNSTFNSLAEYKIKPEALAMMSGERVEVNVEVYKGRAIKLPFDAVLNRNGKSYVFVREHEKAVPQEVTIIQTGEDGAVISNNDIAGKEIVVEKQDILLKLLSGVSIHVKGK